MCLHDLSKDLSVLGNSVSTAAASEISGPSILSDGDCLPHDLSLASFVAQNRRRSQALRERVRGRDASALDLASLTVENRRRAATLRARLGLWDHEEAASGSFNTLADLTVEHELKTAELRLRLANRPLLDVSLRGAQVGPSYADLSSINALKTAELQYLMASRRVQTLVDTGVPDSTFI